jgi:hypothetical protein
LKKATLALVLVAASALPAAAFPAGSNPRPQVAVATPGTFDVMVQVVLAYFGL